MMPAPQPSIHPAPREKADRLKSRHLLQIEGLEAGEIRLILDTAEEFLEIGNRPVKKVPALRNRTVINAFFEPSTRTRTSFEIAEKRLSADTLNFSAGTSSVSKGETLLDTVRNLEAMSPDVYVVRHSSPGAPHLIARHVRGSVLNAGDGAHEHPTQALLDAFTMRKRKGDLASLRVAIVGDIQHSRVARSNIHLLRTMGAEVTLCGPPTLVPPWIAGPGVAVTHRIEEALEGRDVVMALRIQLERQDRTFFPSVREYYNRYALTAERMKLAAQIGRASCRERV